MNSAPFHNISRNHTQNCWSVRITRNGVKRSKSFSDSKMPIASPVVSLVAAMRMRDEMVNASFKDFKNNY